MTEQLFLHFLKQIVLVFLLLIIIYLIYNYFILRFARLSLYGLLRLWKNNRGFRKAIYMFPFILLIKYILFASNLLQDNWLLDSSLVCLLAIMLYYNILDNFINIPSFISSGIECMFNQLKGFLSNKIIKILKFIKLVISLFNREKLTISDGNSKFITRDMSKDKYIDKGISLMEANPGGSSQSGAPGGSSAVGGSRQGGAPGGSLAGGGLSQGGASWEDIKQRYLSNRNPELFTSVCTLPGYDSPRSTSPSAEVNRLPNAFRIAPDINARAASNTAPRVESYNWHKYLTPDIEGRRSLPYRWPDPEDIDWSYSEAESDKAIYVAKRTEWIRQDNAIRNSAESARPYNITELSLQAKYAVMRAGWIREANDIPNAADLDWSDSPSQESDKFEYATQRGLIILWAYSLPIMRNPLAEAWEYSFRHADNLQAKNYARAMENYTAAHNYRRGVEFIRAKEAVNASASRALEEARAELSGQGNNWPNAADRMAGYNTTPRGVESNWAGSAVAGSSQFDVPECYKYTIIFEENMQNITPTEWNNRLTILHNKLWQIRDSMNNHLPNRGKRMDSSSLENLFFSRHDRAFMRHFLKIKHPEELNNPNTVFTYLKKDGGWSRDYTFTCNAQISLYILSLFDPSIPNNRA